MGGAVQLLSAAQLKFHAEKCFKAGYIGIPTDRTFTEHNMKPRNGGLALPQRLLVGNYDTGIRRIYAYMLESSWDVHFSDDLYSTNFKEPDWESATLLYGLQSIFHVKGKIEMPFVKAGLETFVRFCFLQAGLITSFPLLTDKTLSIFENVCKSIANKTPLDPTAIQVRALVKRAPRRRTPATTPTSNMKTTATSATKSTTTTTSKSTSKTTNLKRGSTASDTKALEKRKETQNSLMNNFFATRATERSQPPNAIHNTSPVKTSLVDEVELAKATATSQQKTWELQLETLKGQLEEMKTQAITEKKKLENSAAREKKQSQAIFAEQKAELLNQIGVANQTILLTKAELEAERKRTTALTNDITILQSRLVEHNNLSTEAAQKIEHEKRQRLDATKKLMKYQEETESKMKLASSLFSDHKEILEHHCRNEPEMVKKAIMGSLETNFGALKSE